MLDSLGRRNFGWAKAGPGRKPKPYGMGLTEYYNLRLDKETLAELKARAQADGVAVSIKLRDYIEWGLMNDKGDK